jgi:hypothetical protein
VPDLKLAPELGSVEVSREPEFEQVRFELELERERVESGLEQNLGLELELGLEPDWGA